MNLWYLSREYWDGMNSGKQPLLLRKNLKYRFQRGEGMSRLWMKKDATENGTTGSSLQCNVVGKKDRYYLEVSTKRHNALLSHSLLPLVSSESTPWHWIWFLKLSTFIPRWAPKMQAIPRSSKLKHIQEGADWWEKTSSWFMWLVSLLILENVSQIKLVLMEPYTTPCATC